MPGGIYENTLVEPEWLIRELRAGKDSGELLVLDCRLQSDFASARIRGSVSLVIPSIMLRRLAAGKVDLFSTIKCNELKERVKRLLQGSSETRGTFVLIGDSTEPNGYQQETIQVLGRRLKDLKGNVVVLLGGFEAFRDKYPEWCECNPISSENSANQEINEGELMGLRSLRISASPARAYSDSDSDSTCDSLGPDDDKDFPVEILPYLYLGNAANSEDEKALSRHRIEYILNVTPDLPNVFEESGSIKYMQIPISDHWSQNLASFFPQAIQFIEEARSSDKGVLVHCLAGVSRSVTITVAYLMHKCSLSLNDAFNLVRSRKSNIAPNFHFMEQLYRFENELKDRSKDKETKCIATCRSGMPCSCSSSTFLSPLDLGLSPDSGIEFDRWASGTPAE